jgi:hypothetical protein
LLRTLLLFCVTCLTVGRVLAAPIQGPPQQLVLPPIVYQIYEGPPPASAINHREVFADGSQKESWDNSIGRFFPRIFYFPDHTSDRPLTLGEINGLAIRISTDIGVRGTNQDVKIVAVGSSKWESRWTSEANARAQGIILLSQTIAAEKKIIAEASRNLKIHQDQLHDLLALHAPIPPDQNKPTTHLPEVGGQSVPDDIH